MKKLMITLLLSSTTGVMGMDVATAPRAAAVAPAQAIAKSEFILKAEKLDLLQLLDLQSERNGYYNEKSKEYVGKKEALTQEKAAELTKINEEKEAARKAREEEVSNRYFFKRPFASTIDFEAHYKPKYDKLEADYQAKFEALDQEFAPVGVEENALAELVQARWNAAEAEEKAKITKEAERRNEPNLIAQIADLLEEAATAVKKVLTL